MKNILYIGGFELPDKNAAAHRVINNAKAIRKLGYNVIFLGIDKLLNVSLSDNCSKIFNSFDYWSRSYTNDRLYKIDDVKKIYERYNGEIQYIIAYNYPAIALLKLLLFCKKRNIKLICDCTEWYDTKGLKGVKKIIKGFDTFLRMRILHKHVAAMIVISEYLRAYYANKIKTIKVPPLIDINVIGLNKYYYDSNINKIYLVYSGSPGLNKDKLNIIIESLYNNKDRDFLFSVVGVEKEDYLRMYPNHITILNKLKDKIIFKGRVSHENSINEIRKADFFMFYRDKNRVSMAGFPTKFTESYSCGIPIITSKTSDLEEYLIESKNGFWLSEDQGKINEQIKKILNMDKKSIKQIHEYCESKRNRFDYNLFIDDFERLLNERYIL